MELGGIVPFARSKHPLRHRQASIAALAPAGLAAMPPGLRLMNRMWLLMACGFGIALALGLDESAASARATSSLLVSCVLRTAITSAALILFKTAISVFMAGSRDRESFSRFWIAASTAGALLGAADRFASRSRFAPSVSSTVA